MRAGGPRLQLGMGLGRHVVGMHVGRKFDELHESGRTIVLITHEAEVAERAQRVLHVRDGRLTDAAGAGAR